MFARYLHWKRESFEGTYAQESRPTGKRDTRRRGCRPQFQVSVRQATLSPTTPRPQCIPSSRYRYTRTPQARPYIFAENVESIAAANAVTSLRPLRTQPSLVPTHYLTADAHPSALQPLRDLFASTPRHTTFSRALCTPAAQYYLRARRTQLTIYIRYAGAKPPLHSSRSRPVRNASPKVLRDPPMTRSRGYERR
ncbi:hypothetical protein HYPSUDRAFT_69466 [Hypholoma sublateritium FD-334 SS-4]|uniref:Uncharacterized protein n=1 Tax=Hypholoma sublateritium (strain FD-334 SS-4) TaxID=945553 RepID=A0A0D2NJQ9_HYPSF|nr:hypothetical protein HYPSUDRAFT_69466 [Hypholoma sublateritium FD-334 SS-4]